MTVRFELFVTDIDKSVEFYTKTLGFTHTKTIECAHTLSRGNVIIGLGMDAELKENHYFLPEVVNQRKGLGVEIVLEVENIHAEYEAVKKSGYPIYENLITQEWGLTDFRLKDPDGYYLRITSRT